jgi:S1-C subfamily serine protease
LLAATLAVGTACVATRAGYERRDVVRRVLPSTVQLRSEREGGGRRTASGVVLAADPSTRRAWIVTARHFLDPPRRQEVYARRPGRADTVAVRVVAQSDAADVAVLEIQGLELVPVPLKPTVALGDEVLVLAFPWGRRLTVSSGIVSQLAPEEGAFPLEGAPRMVDVSVSYGASGGGVFDARSGALVGIVEGYRTARMAHPESPERPLEIPVAGETTVIPARTIRESLVVSGLEAYLAR